MCIGSDTLECRICKKLFPKYDQRGYRNAGFTAHQNRCIERESILASSPVQVPVKRRRLLPAPPKENTGERLTATQNQERVNVSTEMNHPTIQYDEQNPSSHENPSTSDFQPVLRCNYCEPENGVHQGICSIIRFIEDNSDAST
jgi:hypothetical protein